MLNFNPEDLTDAQVDARLAKEYPPEDFNVRWWWIFPDERRGFAISASLKFAVTQEAVERNLYDLRGRG